MQTYRLSKPAAHELARHLLGIAAERIGSLRGIGDIIRLIAERDAARRARTLADLREQSADLARRISELEACE